MSRSVSTAVLVVMLTLGVGGMVLRMGTATAGAERRPPSPEVKAGAERRPASPEVKIGNFTFGPGTLTVSVGTTVTWTNHDDVPHTVVSSAGVFKSKVLDTDEKFSFTFSKPGTYGYFCSLHPMMTGNVVVQ